MRTCSSVVLLCSLPLALVVGCTPYIPVKPGFATSALAPVPDIPPEFVEFNKFDPTVNPLLATQLCATAYQHYEEKSLSANTGRLVEARGRCQTHVPIWGR